MTYTDAHGRPELVMHPDIVRGTALIRTTGQHDDPSDAIVDVAADIAGEAGTDQSAGRAGTSVRRSEWLAEPER